MKERNATVNVVCPRCKTGTTIRIDRIDSYTDRTCPVCGSDMPFLPARTTGPVPRIEIQEDAAGNGKGTITIPITPPADADKKKPWQSPDGSVWHYSYSNEKWVRVPTPGEKQ